MIQCNIRFSILYNIQLRNKFHFFKQIYVGMRCDASSVKTCALSINISILPILVVRLGANMRSKSMNCFPRVVPQVHNED